MRYEPINPELFVENRRKLAAKLAPDSVAVLHANAVMPTSADGTMPFIQQTDLFYLTGVDQEETVLVLFPDAPEEKYREVLFVRETNEQIAIWEGEKLDKAQARKTTGIQTVYWTHQFDSIFRLLMIEAQNVYLNTNEHFRAAPQVKTPNDRFIKECRQNYPLHDYRRLSPILHELRAVKHDIEVQIIKHACDITEKAFRRVLQFVKPGVMEYEIQAEILHEFLRNGSRRPAYEPIVASGANSCVLHYVSNHNRCQDGDLLLMDFGCEYANYASDLSRTIPVNGTYTPRQREVYQAVLSVQKQAIQMLRPGNALTDYHKEVGSLMEAELIQLGLLTAEEVRKQDPDRPAYKRYFMHGTSHHLGLDVHDYGNRFRQFEPGMVFTCEPGIYIREEGIGVRIENDVLVTDGAPIDLMASIPVEIEEIEELMAARS